MGKTSAKMSFYIKRLKSHQNYTWCDNANSKIIIIIIKKLKPWSDKVYILKYLDATKTQIILSFLVWEGFVFLFPGVHHVFYKCQMGNKDHVQLYVLYTWKSSSPRQATTG